MGSMRETSPQLCGTKSICMHASLIYCFFLRLMAMLETATIETIAAIAPTYWVHAGVFIETLVPPTMTCGGGGGSGGKSPKQ